jgi:hypothetical protein
MFPDISIGDAPAAENAPVAGSPPNAANGEKHS